MGNKTSTKKYIYNMKNLSTKLNETGKEIYILETQLSNEDIDVNIKIEIIKKSDCLISNRPWVQIPLRTYNL